MEIHPNQLYHPSHSLDLTDPMAPMSIANNFRSVFQLPQNPPFLFPLLLLLQGPFFLHAKADDPLGNYCYFENSTSSSTYQENLNYTLSSISSENSPIKNGFYNLSYGQSPDRVNAIALCRGDVALSDCRACLNRSSIELVQKCPLRKGAVIWYDNCMLRYSNMSIFGLVDWGMFTKWSNTNITGSVTDFTQVLRGLMVGLTRRAAAGNSTLKFAAGDATVLDFGTLYGLVQCTPHLSEVQCNDCLMKAIGCLSLGCVGRIGGRAIGASCNLRFEVNRFYDPSAGAALAPLASPPTKGMNAATTTSVAVALIVTVCLLITSGLYIRRLKVRKPLESVETTDEIGTAESLQYDFATVRDATDNFSEENKLGQGGFGPVYKGKLAIGQEIAVKRLSRGHGQGDQEFKTEVFLVARLQHRNLVRLLGFCLSGEERLLIYEFMPNSSLDRFIFDPVKRPQLDWEMRRKIIAGIARGLGYLHVDSQLRIIHRDLKASNILLDAEMTPKISDFGLARLFVMDETHAATNRIAGTYGYMAPEYALYGQFSVKSDVFSFGILVLEIISGQKNNSFRIGETMEDLLGFVWRNWREGTISNVIDTSLSYEPRTEIQRYIHIGLLCVQENGANRPNMNSVLLMFNSVSMTLPVPSRPALYMHSSRDLVSDESNSRSYQSSVNEASITDMFPR